MFQALENTSGPELAPAGTDIPGQAEEPVPTKPTGSGSNLPGGTEEPEVSDPSSEVQSVMDHGSEENRDSHFRIPIRIMTTVGVEMETIIAAIMIAMLYGLVMKNPTIPQRTISRKHAIRASQGRNMIWRTVPSS